MVSKQNLQSSVFKSPEALEIASKVFKLTPLVGIHLNQPADNYAAISDLLNKETDGEFASSAAHIDFGRVLEKVYKDNFFFIIHVTKISIKNKEKALLLNSKFDLKRPDDAA